MSAAEKYPREIFCPDFPLGKIRIKKFVPHSGKMEIKMLYYLYYASYLLLIPAFIFTMWAQINVNSTFKKSSGIPTGLSGAAAARRILDQNGLYSVRIERVAGHLSDHYDPKANVIRLSNAVYDQCSAAAVGVAAHEAGHAVQHATGYAAIKLRMAIIPVCSFGSQAAMPLFFLGLILSSGAASGSDLGYYLMMVGILFYSLAVLFQLVTLPVEFDASRRAMAALTSSGSMSDNETRASRKVLTAAALTYVAALATSLLSLLRLILIAAGGRRRD